MVLLRPDVIVVSILLFGLAGSFFVVRWIFDPIYDAETSRRPPTQFFTIDFFALLVPLMVAGAALTRPHTSNFNQHVSDGVNVLCATLCAGIFWWRGTVILSHASVMSSWRRFVFLAFVNPLAFCGAIAAIVLPLLSCYVFINMFSLVGALLGLVALPAWVGICTGILLLFRYVALWLLRDRAVPQ